MDPLIDIIRASGLELFAAEFVSSVRVGDSTQEVAQVEVYILAADSAEAAQIRACELADSLSDRYRNTKGQVVSVECRGVTAVAELSSAEYYGALHVATVRFADCTRVKDLMSEVRSDLPNLDRS